jgi:hypothetical protein
MRNLFPRLPWKGLINRLDDDQKPAEPAIQDFQLKGD